MGALLTTMTKYRFALGSEQDAHFPPGNCPVSKVVWNTTPVRSSPHKHTSQLEDSASSKAKTLASTQGPKYSL